MYQFASAKDLETQLTQYLTLYTLGKEDETNWQQRQQTLSHLHSLIIGNAPTDFSLVIDNHLRTLLDTLILCVLYFINN